MRLEITLGDEKVKYWVPFGLSYILSNLMFILSVFVCTAFDVSEYFVKGLLSVLYK